MDRSPLRKLIPTYGNWGGPGWSGGRYEDDIDAVDWDVPAVDELDKLFKNHDWLYQVNYHPRWLADRVLLRQLDDVEVKGIWPNIYRLGCRVVFEIKLAIDLCDWDWRK